MNAASVLGIGLVFTLKDEVSNAASAMTQKFQQLNYVSSETAAKMESSLKGIGTGFKMMGAGAAILAPLGLAVNAAAQFEGQLKELSAITGVTGGGLEDIGNRAQGLALKFGGDPLKSVESFKTILSRLGPDIAKSPEALQNMGDAVETLAKTMGGDTLGSVNALTTGMLQYGIDLSDPIKASQAMAHQMNVMAAGAQVGSAEVPQIAESLKVAGLAAKTSGLSFEEFNAAVQVMGKGTVYGAEAGTALRNVLGKLGESRFLPKDAAKELQKAGVDINRLADTTIPFKDRLKELNKIQGDAALVSKLFGVENKNAAMLLMQNVGDLESWTTAVTGTNSASDQAAVIMSGFNETLTRGQAAIKVAAISIGTALLPMASQLLNVFGGLLTSFSEFAQSNIGKIFVKIAATVGVGLVAMGGFVSAFHAVKFAMAATQPVLMLAKTNFTALARTFHLLQMAAPIAFNSIKMGFASMRVAAMSALTPLLPYLLPIGLAIAVVSAAVYVLVKGYQSFQKVLDGGGAETGFLGFLQKVGGAIHAVIEIWKSATSEGFTLSGKFYEALERIGLEKFALNVGTWIVRIKAFFGGMSERGSNLIDVFGSVWSSFERVGSSLSNAFSAVGRAFAPIMSLMGKAIDPIFDLFSMMGFNVEKLGGDVEWFAMAGKIAFEAVMLPIRAIAIALELVANVITVVIDGYTIFYNFVANTFDAINWYIDLFKADMISFPKLFSMIGNAITHNLLEGIKAGWASITTFMVNSLKALPGGEMIASYFGIGGSETASQTAVAQTGLAGQAQSDASVSPSQANGSFTKKMDSINNAVAQKEFVQRQANEILIQGSQSGQSVASVAEQKAPIVNVIVEMDGDNLAKKINVRNEFDDARS